MAIDRKWKYSLNQFLYATRDSNEKAVKLILYHLAKLKAYKDAFPLDADYILLYNRTLTVANDAETKYMNYYSVEGAQEGQTLNVDLRLKGIKGKDGKARDWYNRSAAIYAITDKPRMLALFPDGLKPFKGKKDSIIKAVNTLSLNIGSDSNVLMIAIKSEVDAEYAIVNPDRVVQKSAITTTTLKSDALSAACVAAMRMEYRNTGILIDKFPDNTDDIQKSFHDLETLQNTQQKVWNLTFNPLASKDIVARTVVFNTKMRGKAMGGAIKLFLASTLGGTDSIPKLFPAGLNIRFTAADFGITDYVTHRYFTAINEDGVIVTFLLQMY